MASFLNGADCGPSNALKSVSGRLERDNALFQDRLISQSNVVGPSTQPFSTSRSAQHQNTAAPGPSRAPFDLGALRQHLSSPPQNQDHSQVSQWAASFNPTSAAERTARNRYQSTSHDAIVNRANPWGNDFLQQSGSAMSARNSAPPGSYQHQQSTYQARANGGQAFQPQLALPHPSMNGFAHSMSPYAAPSTFQYGQVAGDSRYGHYNPAPDSLHPLLRNPETGLHQSEAQDPTTITETRHSETPSAPLTADQELLAKTAEQMVNGLMNEDRITLENPKLAQSEFYRLVQGLGERKVVVHEGSAIAEGEEVGEGAKFVSRTTGSDWASAFMAQHPASTLQSNPSSSKSQQELAPQLLSDGQPIHRSFGHYISSQNKHYSPGVQTTPLASNAQLSEWDGFYEDQEAILQSDQRPFRQRSKSVHFDDDQVQPLGNGIPSSLEEALMNSTAIPGASSAWQEEGMDDLAIDEEAFQQFNGTMRTAHSPRIGVGAMESWGSLQSDWDIFQQAHLGHAEDPGRYLFQSGNPYNSAVNDIERFGRESPTLKGVLELEAEVQADPQSHDAWYALGLKQQENEREQQAISALSKVIEIDPGYRPAYLALAVSYTNEGNKERANDMLGQWIGLGGDGALAASLTGLGLDERRGMLINRLIEMARESPEDVDADIQIALGVVFNASEEWEKAEDCFFAALSVRPDDWLLYNRLGATMANSGRSAEAIEYYHQALSLHPNFVRALFNLGIARSNLGQYALAAQKIIDALRLQHADATEGYSSYEEKKFSVKGVTSDALWTALRNACLHMGRQDLVALASKRDLAAFPINFESTIKDDRMEDQMQG